MQVKASINNLPMSPKKVRLTAAFVTGMKVQPALDQLRFLNKRSAKPVMDLIESGVANAEHNFKLERSNLFIRSITTGKAITLKRFTPKAHGRATPIHKVRAHVYLILEELVPSKEHEGVKTKEGKNAKVNSRSKIKEATASKTSAPEVLGSEEGEKGKKINDPRMEGKHRHSQHQDQTNKKSVGGTKKTLFHRKAS